MKKTFYQLAAAITFFTRIPIWKIVDIPGKVFKEIIYLFPLIGWITGGIFALSWIGFSQIFPPVIAIILSIICKLLLTGALHEDGLGDFFDGFGGGQTQKDVLRIMKDSHVGSYALIAIVLYYFLNINTLNLIPTHLTASVLFAADPISKMVTALMMNILPYARNESDSKSKTTYEKLSGIKIIFVIIVGITPMILTLNKELWWSVSIPFAIMLAISYLSKKRIGGYTGDVCGASVLLCELGFYLNILILLSMVDHQTGI